MQGVSWSYAIQPAHLSLDRNNLESIGRYESHHECLTASSDAPWSPEGIEQTTTPLVQVRPCPLSPYRWQLSENGILNFHSDSQPDSTNYRRGILRILFDASAGLAHGRRSRTNSGSANDNAGKRRVMCICRSTTSTEASMCTSDETRTSRDSPMEQNNHFVHFSLVRYQSASTVESAVPLITTNDVLCNHGNSTVDPDRQSGIHQPWNTKDNQSFDSFKRTSRNAANKYRTSTSENEARILLPTTSRQSYLYTAGTTYERHANYKCRKKHAGKLQSTINRSATFIPLTPMTTAQTASLLQGSTPMQFAAKKVDGKSKGQERSKRVNGLKSSGEQRKIHRDFGDTSQPSVGGKHFRIPASPYITAAKDGSWEDPQTGLIYPTDLHSYLGHERQESGEVIACLENKWHCLHQSS